MQDLYSAMRSSLPSCLQVQSTFEDLYSEIRRIQAGKPSLAPYAQVANKQILPSEDDACSVLAAYDLLSLPSSNDSAASEAPSSPSTESVAGEPAPVGAADRSTWGWAMMPWSIASMAASSSSTPVSHPPSGDLAGDWPTSHPLAERGGPAPAHALPDLLAAEAGWLAALRARLWDAAVAVGLVDDDESHLGDEHEGAAAQAPALF